MAGDKDPHNPFEDGADVPTPNRKRAQDKDPFGSGNRSVNQNGDDPFSPTDVDIERDEDDELGEEGPSTRDT